MVVVVVVVVRVVLGVTQADPDDGRRWAEGAWPGPSTAVDPVSSGGADLRSY